jgi:hypothetical protein
MNDEIKNLQSQQSIEEKRRRKAILRDRSTIPMDFSAPPQRLCASARESSVPASDPSEPLWKRVWRTEGIRYLGREGNGVIDAMERFEHAFMLGYRHGVGDMLGEAQWLIKEAKP